MVIARSTRLVIQKLDIVWDFAELDGKVIVARKVKIDKNSINRVFSYKSIYGEVLSKVIMGSLLILEKGKNP